MATKAGPSIITDGLVLNIDPANVKSYPAKNDPYRDQVSLLLDGESLTDKSKNAIAVTVQGAVTVDSSVKKNDKMELSRKFRTKLIYSYFDKNGKFLTEVIADY